MVGLESIALALMAFFGSSASAVTQAELVTAGWQIEKFWVPTANYFTSIFSSSKVLSECRDNPEAKILFPRVVHGAQFVSVGENELSSWGTYDFTETRSFYGAPVVACRTVLATSGKVLKWKVISYSRFFSTIQNLPSVKVGVNIPYLLHEGFNLFAAGGLALLSLFSLIIYFGKTEKHLLFSLTLSPILFSLYFVFSSAGLLGISIGMLWAHKLADLGLWTGSLMMLYAYFQDKILTKRMFFLTVLFIALGILVILMGTGGDTVQFGTSIPFVAVGVCLIKVLLMTVRKSLKHKGVKRIDFFRMLSVVALVAVSFNDFLTINGYIRTDLWLPVGLVSGFAFFSLSINEHIQAAYEERDHLREHLEQEVKFKTRELTEKTNSLESAYSELRSAQAEVINSAKLAGLGTMAAGIAHEINNSLNYVNGSVKPLQKRLNNLDLPVEDQKKIDQFFEMIKEGLKHTFDVIQSLRNYTGINKASIDEVDLAAVVKNVLTLVKSKVEHDVRIDVEIPLGHTVYGSIVGLNQILMNLITNGLDAIRGIPTEKFLKIQSCINGEFLELRVTDSGTGIPEAIKHKIFDPFFTTKEVGQGTGLGLHIVKKELDRYRAKIDILSEVNVGTTIMISFPLKRLGANSTEAA